MVRSSERMKPLSERMDTSAHRHDQKSA